MGGRGVELHVPPRGRSAVGRVGTCETLDQSEEVGMESSTPRRILIVAYRTAGTPGLLDEVRRRAARGRCRFVLLVPRPYWDPETEEAALTLELAIPLLEEAAGGQVEGRIGDTDPLVAVRETLEREPFDEVIVSTLPARVSHWLHRDLPSRMEQLGIPVTVVTARTSSRHLLAKR
jgi:hypothetical protein